ncbi:MAG: cupin domain-containing protein [Hyphomicrobiaceae bacterium]
MAKVEIVRHRDLEPFWGVKRATEPGFMRSLITWMGGPEGYINTNVDQAISSRHCAVGIMDMAVGNRQPGVHVHTMNEIYVILDGQVESIDGLGNKHIAGALDCLFIPTGVPHGVRTIGDVDVRLLWVNDDLEEWGAAVYLEGPGPHPADHEITLVEMAHLEPDWSAASQAGQMHWKADWVAASPNNCHAGVGVECDRISLGLCVVQPANRLREAAIEFNQLFVVVAGQAVVKSPNGMEDAGKLDAIFVPAGVDIDLRGHYDDELRLIRIVEITERGAG